MVLKYVGPRELISAHGISFKNGKDDKYVYIYPAIQLYNAIHHEYKKDTVYTYNIEGKRLKDEDILNKIFTINPKFKEIFEEEILEIEKDLNNEIENVKNHKDYNELEKEIYKKNLIIMKSYRIQRATNKIAYKHLIETIVDDILDHKLKELNAPFNERFWHILQTIQGELSNHEKRSVGSVLDTAHGEDSTITLKINSIA